MMLHDPALERALVTATLDGHRDTLGIPLEHFADPKCASLWAAIQRLLVGGLPFTDRVLVANEAAIPSMELPEERYDTDALPEYTARLRRYWMARFIRAQADLAKRGATEGDPEAAASLLIERMQYALHGEGGILSVGEILQNWQAQIGIRIAAWPVRGLQAMLCGIEQSDLILIAGSPSSGKTSLVLQTILHNVGEGRVALFFSMDTSRFKIIRRLINKLTGIPIATIVQHEESPQPGTPVAKRIGRAIEEIRAMPLFIDDARSIAAETIVAKARQIADARGRLDLVVVDFVQLLRLPGKNRPQELDTASQALRALAGDARCAVLGLSQLNRGYVSMPNKKPELSHLRDSGGLEQNADVVLMIWRPGLESDRERYQAANIIVAKSKDTKTGEVECRFDTLYLKFEDKPVDGK